MSVEKNMPEIRFNGFSGEWKTSQLSKLAFFNPNVIANENKPLHQNITAGPFELH